MSLIRLADVGPFTMVAVWRKDEHDPVVLSAIEMLQGRAAQEASARSSPVQRDPAEAKARTQPHRTGLARW